MNRILDGFNQPPLERLGQLFTRTDTNFLVTFRELDHYPDRTDGNYVGTWSSVPGELPDWPLANSSDCASLRIYVYMRQFAELRALLTRLRELAHPTIMYLAGADRELLAGAATPLIRFVSRPVDMARVAQECDLAILYAPHDTVAAMLLAGKPMLLIPQHNEQLIMARSVERLGAAFVASDHDGKQIVAGLDAVIQDDRYSRAARAFADKYSVQRSVETLARVVDRIESLASPVD